MTAKSQHLTASAFYCLILLTSCSPLSPAKVPVAHLTNTASNASEMAVSPPHIVLASHQQQQLLDSSNIDANTNITNTTTLRSFSPHVVYNNNEWRPVGRGDPLKNDPTFDYSPPVLERVRYWADRGDKQKGGQKNDETVAASMTRQETPNKNEILLLGQGPPQLLRNGIITPQLQPHPIKNTKGELPLLQPKFNTAMRRSYYPSQQKILPTHLMPPPMMNLEANEKYKHNVQLPATAHSSTVGFLKSTGSHSTPHYATSSSPPWHHDYTTVHHLHSHHQYPREHHHHHQQSANYFSYTRPSSSISTADVTALRSHPNAPKSNVVSAVPGKPWLQELLQKEIIKTTMPATKDLISPSHSSSFTHALPYSFVSPTTATTLPTTSPLLDATPIMDILTPSSPHTLQPKVPPTTPFFVSSTVSENIPTMILTTNHTTALGPVRLTTVAPALPMLSRLLIPNTSNLLYRPTVAPMGLTTDSLFKHYNQPDKPLRGPMYLIIEGHSKVKKYGKNEIDLHQPKIVPIISKREPVVRFADPNEAHRGTPESYLVKHLHTKTTPIEFATTTTTTISVSSSTTDRPRTSTTFKPHENAAPSDSPIGDMRGLLNILGNMFAEEQPDASQALVEHSQLFTERSVLNPVLTTTAQPMAESRVDNSRGNDIATTSDEDALVQHSTVPPPHKMRQVVPYDHESDIRLKQLLAIGSEDNFMSSENWSANAEKDEADDSNSAAEEYEDDGSQLIKRIDQIEGDVDASLSVVYVDDTEDVDRIAFGRDQSRIA